MAITIITGDQNPDDLNDSLIGTGGNDSISGLEGNDTLIGGAGSDTLLGGNGDDRLIDSNADEFDIFTGGAGADTFVIEDDGSGNAITDFSLMEDFFEGVGSDIRGHIIINADHSVTVEAHTILSNDDAEYYLNNVYLGFDLEAASVLADRFVGFVANPTIAILGTGPDDVIVGSAGNDFIVGGIGDDTVDGGAGRDTIHGGSGDDTISGGTETDYLYGDSGNDSIDGGSSGDRIFFMNNEFDSGDTINGGADTDYLDMIDFSVITDVYFTNVQSVENLVLRGGGNVVLGDESEEAGIMGAGGYGGASGKITIDASARTTDGLILHGNNDKDLIIGGSGKDFIFGMDGNDTLDGGNGNDDLDGGNGSDILYGGLGSDEVYGGNGDDVIHSGEIALVMGPGAVLYTDTDGAINILHGDDGDDILQVSGNNILSGSGVGIGKLYGDDGNDMLIGNLSNDTLDGGAGNDKLYGGNGSDILYGGLGSDEVYGGNGDDVIHSGEIALVMGPGAVLYTDTDGAINILHGDGGDDILQVSGNNILSGSGVGIGKLYGDDGNDMLIGNLSNDTLDGGAGADLLNGGGGTDTASYASAVSAVTVNLMGTASNAGDAAGDSYVSIEKFKLSNNDDIFVGSVGDDDVDGGDGDDRLFGGSGTDILNGGAGNDFLHANAGYGMGGDGLDVLDGGAGNDTLLAGDDVNTLTGGTGADTFRFLAGTSTEAETDLITDFSRAEGDKIDVTGLGLSKYSLDTSIIPGGTIVNFDGSNFSIGLKDFYGEIGVSDFIGLTGGGGGKIICTELHRQGLMSDSIFRADQEFGRYLAKHDPEVLIGYWLWAQPVVNLMKKSSLFTHIVKLLAMSWAEEMAYSIGATEKPGGLFGKILMKVGIPTCRVIGKLMNRRKTVRGNS